MTSTTKAMTLAISLGRMPPDAERCPSKWGAGVHAMMLIQHGVYLLENLELEALAAARAYEFAFIVQPLKLRGATGSAVAPMAIR